MILQHRPQAVDFLWGVKLQDHIQSAQLEVIKTNDNCSDLLGRPNYLAGA